MDQHGRVAPPGVIEVYPHPALVELAGASERLPYIASKVWSYWPSATQLEQRARLCTKTTLMLIVMAVEIGTSELQALLAV